MADITENLFQSIDIISKKQLESLSFDTTIEATVVDASRAQDGIYTVSTGNSNFLAYSTETGYNENDAVMVTVPQGDYNKQKMIIGKQVDNTNTPMIYKSPFQQLINVSNNLISEDIGEISIWANTGVYINPENKNNIDVKDNYGWNENIINFWESNAFKSTNLINIITNEIINNDDEDSNINTTTTKEVKAALIWDSNPLPDSPEMFESRYTRLGVKAQFSTWLSEYNTAYGNYGLAIVLIFSNNDSSGRFGKVITFDSSEFFGDVYNFETYYTQEALFDISEFIDYPIRQIQLYAYQRNNFKNADGEFIYTAEDIGGLDGMASDIQPNIFIKDPYICLGMPTSEFNADVAEIISGSSSTYSKWVETEVENKSQDIDIDQRENNNIKELQLRWIHKDAKSDIIATVQENEIPTDYEIWWYRYKLGTPSVDQFAGAHWERFYGCKSIANENEEYCLTKEEIENGEEDLATNCINITFYPNVNHATEQLKVIIIKKEQNFDLSSSESTERLIATTPIITFTNSNDVRSKATFIDENALSIRFEDDEKGNYFLYNRAGNVSKEEDKEIRVLSAVFDTKQNNVYEKPLLTQPYTSIKWSFPASNTMIIPATNDSLDAIPLTNENISNSLEYNKDIIMYNSNNDTYEFIFERKQDDNNSHWKDYESSWRSVGYFIKPTLNHNANRNIISLEINKDGQLYIAEAHLFFGTAGTSGSDYTIAVEWINDNAFDLSKGVLNGRVHLYDQAGQEVDLETSSTYQYSWYKVREKNNNMSNKITPEQDTNELYYPVANNALQSLEIDDINENRYLDDEVDYLADFSSGVTYYYYDLNSKSFKPTTWNNNQILYRKQQRKKLSFKAFQAINDNPSGTGLISEDFTTFYYDNNSNKRRAFIKYDDIYIIDPWDQYYSNETYYYPAYTSNKNYNKTFLKINVSQSENNLFSIEKDLTIYENNFSIETDLYILEIKLTNFGDYNLIARFPIPLKNGDSYHDAEGQNKYFVVDYIEGPTEVRYSTDGETDFNKNPYEIKFRHLNWENDNVTYNIKTEKDNLGHWELVCEENDNLSFLPNLIEYQLVSGVRVLKKNNFINPLLSPPGIYFSETPIYGVRYVLDKNIIFNNINKTVTTSNDNIQAESNNDIYYLKKNTTLWSQPVYSYQDNYPSTTLNKWNGKDIATNEDQGTIVANGFAAGKKEDDNTFTGVVLGDWSRTDTDKMITKQTGIYGFNHGVMSYALKDDGTAFFGKDGKGRIYFNGNNAQIYSASWVAVNDSNNGIYSQKHQGMMLDVNDGLIDIRNSNGGFIKIKSKNNDVGIDVQGTNHNYTLIKPGLLEISVDNNTTKKILLEVSTDNYYLQSKNFSSNLEQGVKFDLRNGKLTGYNFKIQAGSGYDKIIISSDSSEKPLKIGNNKFYVDWDGKLTANNVNITGGSLSIGGNFSVNNSGYLTASGATINGNSTFSGSLNAATGTFAGSLRAATGTFSGTLNATGGNFGNITSGSISIGSGDTSFGLASNGKLTARDVDVSGMITATTGKIGGWKIESTQLESVSGDTILYNSGKAKFGYTSIENTGKIAVGDYVTLENVATNGSSGGITVKNVSAGNSRLEIRGSSIYFYNPYNQLTSTISDSGLNVQNITFQGESLYLDEVQIKDGSSPSGYRTIYILTY